MPLRWEEDEKEEVRYSYALSFECIVYKLGNQTVLLFHETFRHLILQLLRMCMKYLAGFEMLSDTR